MKYTQKLEQLELQISQCESTVEFEELVSSNAEVFGFGWKDYMEPLLNRHGLTPNMIAWGCDVVVKTAKSFYNKIPTKRTNVIMLAVMMGLSVEETNDLLMQHAYFQRLYPKNPDDAIWIYLLERGGSVEPKNLFDAYKAQYEKLRKVYAGSQGGQLPMETGIAYDHIGLMASKGSVNVVHDQVFSEMMLKLMPSFDQSYRKLLAYIELHFPYLEREDALDQGLVELEEALRKKRRGVFGGKKKKQGHVIEDKRSTPNEVFDENYAKKYYKRYEKIKQNGTIPQRNFLVSLGVRLNMSVPQINQMLELAGMGPLCAGDRLEAAIIYYLEELDCQIPTYFYRPRELRTDSVYDQLQVFSLRDELERLRRMGQAADDQNSFWSQLDVFCELPPEHLNDYLKRKLEETNIFEQSDRAALDKLLEYL